MIRAALKTKETGAILTTHYMEEVEAVCDRVAIVVSGQLRWAAARPASGWSWAVVHAATGASPPASPT